MVKNVIENQNIVLKYIVDTVIEILSVTLLADKVANGVNFFSFGTNDLKQMRFFL